MTCEDLLSFSLSVFVLFHLCLSKVRKGFLLSVQLLLSCPLLLCYTNTVLKNNDAIHSI